MKIKKTLLYCSLLFAAMPLLFSCTKNETNRDGNARMQVYLTDAPGDYEAVYIDVQDVRINTTTDTASGWVSLKDAPLGTYDLLTLGNDKDTLLADADVPDGRIEQIRLVLGSENYVKVDGKMIKLETPSAEQSGLKLNIHQDVHGGIAYKLLLDFDVAKSIHQAGNGKYMLKPTIRTVLQAVGGSIKGYISPDSVQTAVLAIQGTDTVASTYSLNGGYVLKGLNAGSYDLHFMPTDTAYKTQILTGISVTADNVTVTDTLHLQH